MGDCYTNIRANGARPTGVPLGYTYVERGEVVHGMQADTVLRTVGGPFR